MKLFAVFIALFLNGVEPQILRTPNPDMVEAVDVRGNRRIPSDTIKYNLQIKPGDVVNTALIQRDMKALYALGYFDDIKVEEEDGDRGKIIIFRVVEKPLIRIIDYEGNKSVTLSDILERLREKKVGLSIEAPYDPTRIKRAEVVLLDLLAEKGRQNAKIEVETYDIPPNAIGVAFVIDEGPKIKIEKIEIIGKPRFFGREGQERDEAPQGDRPHHALYEQGRLPRTEDERRHHADPHDVRRERIRPGERPGAETRNPAA